MTILTILICFALVALAIKLETKYKPPELTKMRGYVIKELFPLGNIHNQKPIIIIRKSALDIKDEWFDVMRAL